MAWWRRAVLAVLDSHFGVSLIGVALVFLVLFLPAYLFGKWAFFVIVAFGFGCACGYDFARYLWRKKGYVPKS